MQTLLEQQLGKLYTTVSCNCSYSFSLLGCLMNRFNFYLLKNGSPRLYTSTNGSTEMKENIKSSGCTGETMITASGQISAKAWAVKGLASQQSTTQGWFRLLLKVTTQDMCRLWARKPWATQANRSVQSAMLNWEIWMKGRWAPVIEKV